MLREAGIHRGREVVVYAERHAVDAFVALRALRSIGVADARICLGDDRPGMAHGQGGGRRSTRIGAYPAGTSA